MDGGNWWFPTTFPGKDSESSSNWKNSLKKMLLFISGSKKSSNWKNHHPHIGHIHHQKIPAWFFPWHRRHTAIFFWVWKNYWGPEIWRLQKVSYGDGECLVSSITPCWSFPIYFPGFCAGSTRQIEPPKKQKIETHIFTDDLNIANAYHRVQGWMIANSFAVYSHLQSLQT